MVLSVSVTLFGIGETYLITCETGNETIGWLCRAAYEKYIDKYVSQTIPNQYIARRKSDRCLLSLNDLVKHILNNQEEIEISPTHPQNYQEISTVST